MLYSSHTVWRSYADFEGWTKSEAFRKSHARAGNPAPKPMTLGHPDFEGFHVLQTVCGRLRSGGRVNAYLALNPP